MTRSNIVQLKTVFLGLILSVSSLYSFGQSNYKESSNHFALYTQNGDIKSLQEAKKFIDAAYKTRRDSSSARTNVLRAMIYSSLAYVDSTRTIKYEKDPIDETYISLSKFRKGNRDENAAELSYIRQNLAAAHMFKANTALTDENFAEAYSQFQSVDKINPNRGNIINNLALLAFQSNKLEESIRYYRIIIENEEATDAHFLQLAEIYKRKKQLQSELDVLTEGLTRFPESKNLLFQLLEVYVQNNMYNSIVDIIDRAIELEPENIELNYLAGFANENENNVNAARKYYEKVILLDQNNYDANLALGLIALNAFLNDAENIEAQYDAQNYLLKANEIKPYEINALKSLAVFYENANDDLQLDRVNLLLNQLTNN